MRRLRARTPLLVLLAVTVVALIVRWQFVDFASGDYRAFLSRWYAFISENGGFAALRDDSFSNYNTPYLALLALLTYLPVPAMVAIKALSVVFDLALAVIAYRIVATLRPGARWLPVLAYAVILLLPTVVMNSSVWAQCDAIYATFALGTVLALIKRRPWLAAAVFGLAFAFKLQAIFLLPVLVAVVLINRHRVRTLLAAPAAFFVALVPALLAGRGLLSQLSVYPAQVAMPSGAGQTGGGGGGPRMGGGGGGPGGGMGGGRGGFSATDTHILTNNAPTPYAWLSGDASPGWKYVGLALTVAVVLAIGIWLLRRRRPLGGSDILLLAAASTLMIPVLLPEMHERYFYLAEVLLVLAVFVDRRFVLPAVGIQIATISTYLTYLRNDTFLSLEMAAVLALGSAAVAVILLVSRLRPPERSEPRIDHRTETGPMALAGMAPSVAGDPQGDQRGGSG